MVKPGASLKSSLRKSVIGAYRARGRGKNNLWLVTSVKNKTDWILPSDRQFIHWIAHLETNSDVKSFNLAPDPVLSSDDIETRATELDATLVRQNGEVEWHEVKAGKNKNDPKFRSQFLAQAAAASKEHVKYRILDDTDLKPKVKVSLRWLKPIAFANALREHEYTPCRIALTLFLKQKNSGNIKHVLEALPDHDSAVVLGLLAKLAIEGVIELDLEKSTFGLLTFWKYHA